ncbi:hypothetical protein EJD97_009216 [Solanum chilense]|uniref:Oberon coiled-coil region domain-containing protein n=1 Tax=Solanum chilense TaxID=4083 RepID=A0A6N2BJS7_SOLCI|nr:hypothetical protein EJD97_009216 [Solanum chilense]
MDSLNNSEAGNSSSLVQPQEACDRIIQVLQEEMQKMESVADEKMKMLKKARIALEVCDNELEEKTKEVERLKLERQQKRLELDELDSIVRLKQVEADMFQVKADETRREADRLQMIAQSKLGVSEDDYASRYLQQRLSEAESEKQYLVEKMKLQDHSSHPYQSDDN